MTDKRNARLQNKKAQNDAERKRSEMSHDESLKRTLGSSDERDQRLMLAEEILSDLATGYWVSVLDDSDDPVKERMGQRVLNYWRTCLDE